MKEVHAIPSRAGIALQTLPKETAWGRGDEKSTRSTRAGHTMFLKVSRSPASGKEGSQCQTPRGSALQLDSVPQITQQGTKRTGVPRAHPRGLSEVEEASSAFGTCRSFPKEAPKLIRLGSHPAEERKGPRGGRRGGEGDVLEIENGCVLDVMNMRRRTPL